MDSTGSELPRDPNQGLAQELDLDTGDQYGGGTGMEGLHPSGQDDGLEEEQLPGYEQPPEQEQEPQPQQPPMDEGGLPTADDDLSELFDAAQRTDIQISLEFIRELQAATLDDQASILGPTVFQRLRCPPTTPIELSQDQRLSLELFMACNSAAQEVYNASRTAILRRHPDDNVLTYDAVKKLLIEITGVVDIKEDMCINSCIGYTGPYRDHITCPFCGQDRLDDKTRKPRQQFNTIPLGPQLQALKRDLRSAKSMKYRQLRTDELQRILQENNGELGSYDDILSGNEYLQAVARGHIQPNDIVVTLSFDGAQLFEKKPSDCWIGIWIILELAPEGRYKMLSVLPAFTIPGPSKPQNMDSFMFPTFLHLAALQKDGLPIWDACDEAVITCFPFFALGTADGPGLTHLNGLVGHMGMNGCRLR
ncbi:hypothetical protein DXG01_011528, partial [Tephrocybe rancida]